ncbi:MAG: hypothetical protein NC205_01370 [Prevotella sp.]|nr:hypothetical protein [Alistipes senegalensis]MCM1357215.1 hypothetical protein [Prevotella sp.]MCM1473603.1 hypothetical protein [Muribaculaceae bacterium]
MTGKELEKRYIENGLKDYKLRSTDDLKTIHDVDITKIKGYQKLNVNEEFFKKMLVRFYNAQGLEIRSEIKPLAVKYVSRTKTRKPYLHFEVKIGDSNECFHFNGNGEWY